MAIVTIYVTQNVAGQIESNTNNIDIVPSSPDNDYILLEFQEKQGCNTKFTALFQNITTNCNVSAIDIKTVDLITQNLVNGLVHFEKTGLYNVNVYFQSSSTNIDISLATFSYVTCLNVDPSTSICAGDNSSFDCDDLNNCTDFLKLQEDANPTTQKILINPLLFAKNNDFDVTISVNTTLEVASSGNLDGNVFSMYRFRVAPGITLTFGTSFPAELLADTEFLNSITADKTNTIVLVWDGEQIRRWSNQTTAFGTPLPTIPEIDSYVVNDTNHDRGIITFNVTPTGGTMTGFTHSGGISDVTIVSIISQVANVWVVQLSRSLLNGETGSLVWASSDIVNDTEGLADGSIVVTNQVGAIAANPVFVSAEIGTAADNILAITTDILSDFTFIGTPEIILTSDGGALTVLTAVGDANTLEGDYNLSRSVLDSETITIEVLTANGIGNTLDFSKKMGAVPALTSVTNNVESGFIPLVASATTLITDNGGGSFTSGTLPGNWDAYTLMDVSSPSSTDSAVRFNIVDVNDVIMIGFNLSNVNESFSGYEYGIFNSDSPSLTTIVNGSTGTLDTPVTTINGSVVELARESGNVVINYAADGINFVQVHDFGAETAELFVNINIRNTSVTMTGVVQNGLS